MLFCFIYCPNLTSAPPCPASITTVGERFGLFSTQLNVKNLIGKHLKFIGLCKI